MQAGRQAGDRCCAAAPLQLGGRPRAVSSVNSEDPPSSAAWRGLGQVGGPADAKYKCNSREHPCFCEGVLWGDGPQTGHAAPRGARMRAPCTTAPGGGAIPSPRRRARGHKGWVGTKMRARLVWLRCRLRGSKLATTVVVWQRRWRPAHRGMGFSVHPVTVRRVCPNTYTHTQHPCHSWEGIEGKGAARPRGSAGGGAGGRGRGAA
jgi:hypothetical protein